MTTTKVKSIKEIKEIKDHIKRLQSYYDDPNDGINTSFIVITIKELRIELGKQEILKDIKEGIVPNDVKSFSELHDYVDANYYGGFFDDNYEFSEDFKYENYIQGRLDEWLKTR